jgi:hypothetical protein
VLGAEWDVGGGSKSSHPLTPGPSPSRGEGRKSHSFGFLPGEFGHITTWVSHSFAIVFVDVAGEDFKLVPGLFEEFSTTERGAGQDQAV